ncbi:MAG: hypothetical protein ACRDZ2_16250 [Ilumatobacteraceae bacterium]
MFALRTAEHVAAEQATQSFLGKVMPAAAAFVLAGVSVVAAAPPSAGT